MNKAILMGRITAEPELRSTPSGVNVTQFSLAVDRRFKGQNGEKQTDFINCVAWRNTAEFICKYFGKGSLILVEGSIQTRSYETDGQKRYATEVIVDNACFTGEKKDAASTAPATPEQTFADMDDDSLPF